MMTFLRIKRVGLILIENIKSISFMFSVQRNTNKGILLYILVIFIKNNIVKSSRIQNLDQAVLYCRKLSITKLRKSSDIFLETEKSFCI